MPSSSVQGRPESAVSATPSAQPSDDTRRCPECLAAFRPGHRLQLFCTPAHRDRWNNRAAVRGRVITPLAIVARITREGSRGDREIGKRASAERNILIQRWIEDDAAHGRMAWVEYLRRRYAIGFDPV